MNIKQAKEEIKHTVMAYLSKDEQGEYRIPVIRQRPILLMGPPGIGKTQIMEQIAMEKTQDRITGFIAAHSDITQPRLEELMLDTSMLVKDVGTMLEGEDAVREGLINEIGGIRDALNKLKELMKKNI